MRLDLDLAERMTHAACAAAAGAGCLVSAAVVDAGGHLVAFRRMDGAEFAGATVAVDKAYTAAGNRIATRTCGTRSRSVRSSPATTRRRVVGSSRLAEACRCGTTGS